MWMPKILALVSALGFVMVHSTLADKTSPQDYVDAHNEIRAVNHVAPMEWNETVAQYAIDYANKRAEDCLMQHSGGPYGENLFKGSGDATAKEIVDYWGCEKQFYDPGSNTCAPGESCGHYTQVVAPDSTQLGCAGVKCKNVDWYWFVTCNYYSPGNPGERPY